MNLQFIKYELLSENGLYDWLFMDDDGNKYHYSYSTTIINDAVINTVKQLLINILTPKLQDIKLNKIAELSDLSFSVRQEILPDYKLINASLYVYDFDTTMKYKNIVIAFRTEFYRLKTLIENCKTIEEVNSIQHNYYSISL